ncbi:MAG: YggT family protein [Blastocatellia bacterium]
MILITILTLLGWAVFWIAVGLTALLVLRVIAGWASASYYSWFQFNLRRITEPMVRPLRSEFGRSGARYDLMPLLMAVMILLTGFFVSDMIWRLAGILDDLFHTILWGTLRMAYLVSIIVRLAGWSYVVVLLLRFVLPWLGVGYRNAFMRFIYKITEPLLRPLRRYLVVGMLDLSLIGAIFLVEIATVILVQIVGKFGA